MDFQSTSMVAAFFLFLWLAKSLIQQAKRPRHIWPPGPRKLPLIGNLHQLATSGALPHHALRELARKYGPLMHLQLGEVSAVVVSSTKMARDILRTGDVILSQRPQTIFAKILLYGRADLAFASYGEYWRMMRKVCTVELLSTKRVQSFSYIREDEADKLVETIRLSVGSQINLTTQLFHVVVSIVCRAAFGKTSTNQDEFIAFLKEVLEVFVGFDLTDLFPSIKPIHRITGSISKLERLDREKNKFFDEIIKENRKTLMEDREEADNLIQVLLKIQKSDNLEVPITDDCIKAVIWDVFGAGTDTTIVAIEWAMTEMMRDERVRKKAQAEIREALGGKKTVEETDLQKLSYLKLVVKEIMRLHPPLPLFPRECMEPFTIDGYKIPLKTHVITNVWAVGRDPEVWHDAENFIPERFNDTSVDYKGNNFEFIPFGTGRRICPGTAMALANIELPLARLLYHFDWELPSGMKPEDVDMTELLGNAAGKKHNLYLVPTRYYP